MLPSCSIPSSKPLATNWLVRPPLAHRYVSLMINTPGPHISSPIPPSKLEKSQSVCRLVSNFRRRPILVSCEERGRPGCNSVLRQEGRNTTGERGRGVLGEGGQFLFPLSFVPLSVAGAGGGGVGGRNSARTGTFLCEYQRPWPPALSVTSLSRRARRIRYLFIRF